MCDDIINEYMASTNRDNKLLEINLECGGNIPPRIKVNGIRAERVLKYDEEYCNASQMVQVSLLLDLFDNSKINKKILKLISISLADA